MHGKTNVVVQCASNLSTSTRSARGDLSPVEFTTDCNLKTDQIFMVPDHIIMYEILFCGIFT